MSEQTWKPLFRTPKATITKVLKSPAFEQSRERSGAIIEDPAALRALADAVESLERANAPLSAIVDRVAAALRFLRDKAQLLDVAEEAAREEPSATPGEAAAADLRSTAGHTDLETAASAGTAARERLIVAALHYLVTPVDLVPDFRAGGYIDDVLVLTWVFGAAVQELEPFLEPDPDI